ncbi:MAG: GNAT family N-acetyltransferase [Planctomycetota bacterium]|nr:GNAT family N-acetyltransferase [Planctomycetota bacterium]
MSKSHEEKPVELGVMNERDLGPVVRLIELAFGTERERAEKWLVASGIGNVRVVRDHGSPVACLLRIAMGHYYGGRSVPTVGIAGVAVAPEARGRGLARGMMRAAMQELASERVAISSLYASTQSLYRQVGYEQAGLSLRHELPLAQIGERSAAGEVRELTAEDKPRVEACYAAFARTMDGMLDRGAYIWNRTEKNRLGEYRGFGFFADGELEAYLRLRQTVDQVTFRQTIDLSDVAFVRERGGRRVLRFLSDFGMLAGDATFLGGPTHPLLGLLALQVAKSSVKHAWMLRVCDIGAAVSARGFSPHVKTAFELEISDATCPTNVGVWRVEVEGGAGRATKLAEGSSPHSGAGNALPRARADIRGFAAMYGGSLAPAHAQLQGLVSGDPKALAAMAAAFPVGCPCLVDGF